MKRIIYLFILCFATPGLTQQSAILGQDGGLPDGMKVEGGVIIFTSPLGSSRFDIPVIFNGYGTGNFIADEYDLRVATNDTAAVMRIGNLEFGTSDDRTIGASLTAGGTVFFGIQDAPDGLGEFIFTEAGGDIRIAVPIAGAGYGTANLRSGIYAGPSVLKDSIMIGSYWGFNRIRMNTDDFGADLGIQNNIQVGDSVYVNTNITIGGEQFTSQSDSTLINPNLIVTTGHIRVGEITTPTAAADFGDFYTKTDNIPYFQDGSGTEHVLLTGSTSIQHEFFAPVEDATGTVGNWEIVEINAAQNVHFNFQIPEDFEILDAINVVIIPDATETIQWDVFVSVSAAGEAYNNDDRTTADATLAVTVNLLTEVDISEDFGTIAAGDYIGIDFQSDTANLRVVGLEFDFN